MENICRFPQGFFWGAATSSYQVEGGIENNDWYEACRQKRVPCPVSQPDQEIHYEKDFDLAAALGHNCHRISIEWARIEPHEGKFDLSAIEHYRRVIQALRKRKLEPFVTIWHFTLPLWFVQMGSFENRRSAFYFARYAKFVVDHLSSLCSRFDLMNEPEVFAVNGYLRGFWPPFKTESFFSCLGVLKNLARAHRQAYREIKSTQRNLSIGIVKNNICFWSRNSIGSRITTIFTRWFWNRRFLNQIKGHFDSVGLNYYQVKFIGQKTPAMARSDMGWNIYPEGIYHTLRELRRYKVPVFVSETGIADADDKQRSKYIRDLVYWSYRAMQDGTDLRGFIYWSLIDNYEWSFGYGPKFGLISYDPDSKIRSIRSSAHVFKKICEDNGIIE